MKIVFGELETPKSSKVEAKMFLIVKYEILMLVFLWWVNKCKNKNVT